MIGLARGARLGAFRTDGLLLRSPERSTRAHFPYVPDPVEIEYRADDAIAEVLVHSLRSDQAVRKTFELIAENGSAQDDLDALFAPLAADAQGALDGVRDMANMPLESEPQWVRDDPDRVLTRRSPSGS